ncbi:MAG: sigma-70 family RNA polymerase sigma factor [Saprospiraceae bacterium]|nr:sigma-70 family RNA polymerase sigma factor [Saprospiraceae bacterium]
MCKSCETFQSHIQNGEEGRKMAAKLLFEEEAIHKNARHFYWKYKRFVSEQYESWEDFLVEIVLRIFKEKEAGRGPRENCEGYYFKLTRNICEEMVRTSNRWRETEEQLARIEETTGDPYIIEKVKQYIQKMECKCRTLMYHYHIEEELIKDKDKLVGILKDQCGKDYTRNSIPVHLSGCLDKLAKAVRQDEDKLF